MYLVVGLGNPGRQYEATRHNMGFDVIDRLVEEHRIPQGGVKFNAMYGKGIIGGEQVLLMKPLSYMNLSGGPVRDMANYFKIDPETEMIVIYDDIDLEPGQLRIRKQGSRRTQRDQRSDQTAWNAEVCAYQGGRRSQASGLGSGRSCTGKVFHTGAQTGGRGAGKSL